MLFDLPQTIQDYNFVKQIGKGGFSEVYLVHSLKFNTDFVAKVMPLPNSEKKSALNIIDREIEALMKLNHPHIIRLYDHFISGNCYFIILEYCSNGSLLDEIENSRLNTDKFLTYARQIIDALEFCHQNNIAHHDLKPENVLVDQYGRLKLADFGIALENTDGTLSNFFAGSIKYESPEILNKKLHDPFKSDVWALGVVFAFMLNGFIPWRCDSPMRLKELVNSQKYYLKKSVPPEIAEVIARMIVVDPDSRITMKELKNLPIFSELKLQNLDEAPPDALSPRGRAMVSPKSPRASSLSSNKSELAIEDAISGMKATSSINNIITPRDLKYLKVKKSKALTIYSLNIMNGINQPPKLKSRYSFHGNLTFQ